MRFSVQRSLFQRAFTLVNHAVARGKTEMPLLAHVRLEVNHSKRRAKLQATNLEISLTVEVALEEADASGAIAVPASILTELCSTLEEGKLTFQIDLDVWKIKLTHTMGSATFTGLSAEEFPPFPAIEQEGMQLFPAELNRAIRWTSVSVAHDDGRATLTCILLQGGNERLTLASADGRRVSFGEVVLPAGVDATPLGNVLIPQRALKELSSILAEDTVVMISLNANRSQVLFQTPTCVFSAILMSGEFPNYRAVVPPDRPLRLEVKTEDFLRVVRAARIFTGADQQSARFSIQPGAGFSPGSLTILTKNEVGSNSISIPARVHGPQTEIAFSIQLILEALQTVTSADTALEIGQATAAKTPAPAGLLMAADNPESVHAFMSMKS